MGFETYIMRARAYRTEIDYLTKIAVKVYHSDHGSFLKAMADAWLEADSSNQRILKPSWAAIVVKYDLDKEAEGSQ